MTDSGAPAQANVYVFTAGGSYMGLYAATGANGQVTFLLPADGGNSTNYNGYKFRADYAGAMIYCDPILVTADVNNPVAIAVGGSAAVPSLRLSTVDLAKVEGASSVARATRQSRGEEVQVASLFMLPGMLAGLTNSAIADSNGEYLYFYHNDHLGTPLFLTDVSGVVVWEGQYWPFGDVFTEDRDPDGDGVEVTQPFRFPGQYEDAETGLFYNYFRDYDPKIGRYIEADPIGLKGGVNLFTYSLLNPISLIDIDGLLSRPVTPGPIRGPDEGASQGGEWGVRRTDSSGKNYPHGGLDLLHPAGHSVNTPISGNISISGNEGVMVCRQEGILCCWGKLQPRYICYRLVHIIPTRTSGTIFEDQMVGYIKAFTNPDIPPHVHVEYYETTCYGSRKSRPPF